MKFLFMFNFLLICFSGSTQDYFSRIIPTNDNPLVKLLKQQSEKYIISTDFFNSDGVQGGMIIVSESGDEKVKFDNMDLASDALLIRGDVFYFLGENPDRDGDSTFFLSRVDNTNYNQEWYKEFTIEHPKLNPRTILATEDNIFVVNLEIKSLDANYPQETSIFVFDFEGELQDVWKYNTDNWASFAWNSFVSADTSLILSNIIASPQPGTYSQVLKIDQNGGVIWNYEGNERLANGAVPTWAIELSDSSILQTYYVDRKWEVDFVVNNWYPYPNKFIWLSAEGDSIKEKMILTDKKDFLWYSGLKTGKGDYFFAYGYYEDRRPAIYDQFFGHLTKFTNEGDTIWCRNYQHPSYPDGNIVHNIKDILEEENGDITILADITPPGAKTEIWLFKVNSEGCFINEECEDMTFTTSAEEISSSKQLIYPNPTSEELHISWKTAIQAITILDITGKVVKYQKANGKSATVDMTLLNKGIYIVQIQDDSNTITANKIIKL